MRHSLLPLTLLLACCAAPAVAQQGSDPYQLDNRVYRDRVRLDVGWILASFDSTAQLDSASGAGTSIDLEDDTGLEQDTSDFFLRGHYRFKPKHRLEASYYALRRDGSAVIDRQIEWGDTTWNVNAALKSDGKASFGRVGYAWSFVKKPKLEVALHGDLAYIESGITLEGTTASGTVAKEEGNAGFPYPTLGLSLEAGMGRRTVFDLRVDAFGGVEFSGVEASILAGEVGVRVYVAKHFGIGAHWLLWELDAETTDAGRHLETDWGWDGLTGTFSFTW